MFATYAGAVSPSVPLAANIGLANTPERNMVDLVTVTTTDGCQLDAAYWPADGTAPARADACVLIHGATSHAFGTLQRELAACFAAAGVSVLALSTRGHDVVSRLRRGAEAGYGGVAFEDLDDAPVDLEAGVGWLRERGHTRVALAGHSLGAVKSILTQATRPDDAIAGVIALSPPRLNHQAQLDSANRDRFKLAYEQALRWTEEGRGDDLFVTDVPIPSIFAAAQFVKKYGPEDRYDLARHLPAIHCPTLLVIGTREMADLVSIGATAGCLPDMRKAMTNLTVRRVEELDHSYTGRAQEVGQLVIDWLL